MQCQLDGDSNTDRMLSLLRFYLWLNTINYLHQLSVNIFRCNDIIDFINANYPSNAIAWKNQ